PKVVALSGQEANIRVGDDHFFVTGLSVARCNGQTVFVPQNQQFSTGFTMQVQPTLLPDRRSVMLKFEAEMAELAERTVPLFPVTTTITPVFESGAQGEPVPFTQFVQQPTIQKRGMTKVVGIPNGQTALFYAGRGTHTAVELEKTPILGD